MKLYNAREITLLRPNQSNLHMKKYIIVSAVLGILVALTLIAQQRNRPVPEVPPVTPTPEAPATSTEATSTPTSTPPVVVRPRATTTATSTPPAPIDPAVTAATTNAYTAQVLADINAARGSEGLPKLKLDPRLQRSAYLKLRDMLDKGYFAHGGYNAFIDRAGYPRVYSGENLARYFTEASEVTPAFLASTAHRDNLLATKYTDIGVAYSETDNLLVVHFGSR